MLVFTDWTFTNCKRKFLDLLLQVLTTWGKKIPLLKLLLCSPKPWHVDHFQCIPHKLKAESYFLFKLPDTIHNLNTAFEIFEFKNYFQRNHRKRDRLKRTHSYKTDLKKIYINFRNILLYPAGFLLSRNCILNLETICRPAVFVFNTPCKILC